MFVGLPGLEADIDRLIGEGRHNDALANMVAGVHHHYKRPDAAHHHLYYPNLDRQMQQLAAALPAPAPAGEAARENTLILATEMYQVGGHSRVIIDVTHDVPHPVVVLSDMFGSYRKEPRHLDWLLESLSHAPVIVLPQQTLWAKCGALQALTERLRPKSILYFQHHQDPVPFVGTLNHVGAIKTLVHHCDHNPSLGNTLPGLGHLDFCDEAAKTCAHHLQRETQVIPLYVPDLGRKPFSPVQGQAFSVVTSGTHIKFARSGELALASIARTVLASIRGHFVHIGPIDEDWVAEIRVHLAQHDIDPSRFQPIGPVPSLWAALGRLDAHFYLGSAPVGGGRASIEAQGCGYPVIFHKTDDAGSVLAVDSVYASKDLGWTTLAELQALLVRIGPHQVEMGNAARRLYEDRFSRDEFVRVLESVT
jgi:hypothetical protein